MWGLMRRVGSIRVMYALVELLGHSTALPPEPLLPLGYDDKAALILALEAGQPGVRAAPGAGRSQTHLRELRK